MSFSAACNGKSRDFSLANAATTTTCDDGDDQDEDQDSHQLQAKTLQ